MYIIHILLTDVAMWIVLTQTPHNKLNRGRVWAVGPREPSEVEDG